MQQGKCSAQKSFLLEILSESRDVISKSATNRGFVLTKRIEKSFSKFAATENRASLYMQLLYSHQPATTDHRIGSGLRAKNISHTIRLDSHLLLPSEEGQH